MYKGASHKLSQRGRKLILDGGTQLNNKNSIFAKNIIIFHFLLYKIPKRWGYLGTPGTPSSALPGHPGVEEEGEWRLMPRRRRAMMH